VSGEGRDSWLLDPRWQAGVAAPIALLLVAAGAVSTGHAGAEARQLAPVVGFLVAVLVLAAGCEAEGLFAAAAERIAARAGGAPVRLLAGVFGLAAVSTVVLSLDTTVVLVTPVVVAAARRSRLSPAPGAYAGAHLANSASLLLPVSNLTNLLALAVMPIGFGRFVGLMTLPWIAVLAVEWLGLRTVMRAELRRPDDVAPPERPVTAVPLFASAVVTATLAGFVVASFAGIPVAWPAAAGAALVTGRLLLRRRLTPAAVFRAAQIPFAVFVLALGVVVRAISDNGAGNLLGHLVPGGSSFAALLGVAVLGAVTANLVNNLPATLLLLPLVASGGVGPVLALLIGVDVGPNLAYPGSLATLLWRRQVGDVAGLRRWTVLGLATVPAGLLAATAALWLGLRV
jgi:arsenical pump membrane protein